MLPLPRHLVFLAVMCCLLSLNSYAQSSIEKKDIAITTQLTFLKVTSENDESFRQALSKISRLSKKIALDEKYDWLTYQTAYGTYLIINFSHALNDVITFETYENEFLRTAESETFLKAFLQLKACDIQIERNFLQEMILPWSTVIGISTAKHPLTTMVEYRISTRDYNEFDRVTRNLAKLLEEVDYPYPMEGNRGVLGAYGHMYHIWFFDQEMSGSIHQHLKKWMRENGRLDDYLTIKSVINDIVIDQKESRLTYLSNLSY